MAGLLQLKDRFRPDDVVLNCVKTQGTGAVLDRLAAVMPWETPVVCAQNAVCNEPAALRLFPNVYGMNMMIIGTHVVPGVVQVFTGPCNGILDLGRYPGGSDDTAREIAVALSGVGFESEAVPDIMRWKYGKLLLNLVNEIVSYKARLIADTFLRTLFIMGLVWVADISAYFAGRVTLANAVGTGVADDKAVYTYMPEIIRFFTGEDAILQNVPTWRCREPDALKEVLDKLPELVVKEVGGSGGYGMLVGPTSTKAEIEDFRAKLIADPDDFIAQPTLSLSTAPTLAGGALSPRHVDLRPFVLSSPAGVRVAPGGLTRVALKEGSLVVNSSQGGGTKDTWVLDN